MFVLCIFLQHIINREFYMTKIEKERFVSFETNENLNSFFSSIFFLINSFLFVCLSGVLLMKNFVRVN